MLQMRTNSIHLFLLLLVVFSSCSTNSTDKSAKEDTRTHFKIGEKEWLIELPKNYVSFANIPDTIEHNNMCGKFSKTTTIQILKLQEKDTLWKDPLPNSLYVFLVPQESMKTTKKACVKDMIEGYAGFISINGDYRYEHKESEVQLDGVPFSLVENSLIDTTGKLSHGDLQFIGIVSKHWMQIQLSFNSTTERDKLKALVMKSEFE
jgi:hypothetical protein